MKFLKSRFFAVCLILSVLLAAATALLAAFGVTGPLRAAVNTVAKPFAYCGAKAADAVDGFVSVFRDHERLTAENEALRAENEALKEQQRDVTLLQEENAWLKTYLNISQQTGGFSMADARVIARSSDAYSTVLTLDKGSVHGVKAKMTVITAEGVFGYVKEVGLDWCHVVSIAETAGAVGVYTDRAGVTGVVEGDPALRAEGICRMTYIESSADLRIGDLVYTAGGSESIYPSGLPVGEITAIEADEYTRTLTAIIQPAADLSAEDGTVRMMILLGYGEES